MGERNDAQVVAELVERLSKPQLLDIGANDAGERVQALLRPTREGVVAQSVKGLLEEYRRLPERRTGQAKLETLESFIAHVNRFRSEASALFAHAAISDGVIGASLVAVIDYHAAGHDSPASWGKHRASYEFPISENLSAWVEGQGKWLTQRDFAEFLETRLEDVLAPEHAGPTAAQLAEQLGLEYASPSKLAELSRGLKVRVDGRVTSAINLSSGETQIAFKTEHQDENGAPLRVPPAFVIGVSMFEGGDRFTVVVRLRYRVKDGAVIWSYQLHRLSDVFRMAFREACALAGSKTTLPLFYGTPEV
jgi:uncharacterized protein YfdQ (DUF2303 family)